MINIEPPQIDRKLLAARYLRAVGVEYNDLITGDHAATLLAHFDKLMVDHCNELIRVYWEKLRLGFEPIQFRPLGEEIEREGK